MHKYVVSYKTGLRDINRLLQVANKKDVLEKAKLAFSVTGDFALEVYNEEFGLYIRIDADSEMPDGGRLVLVELQPSATPKSTPSTSDVTPILTLQPTLPVTGDVFATALQGQERDIEVFM